MKYVELLGLSPRDHVERDGRSRRDMNEIVNEVSSTIQGGGGDEVEEDAGGAADAVASSTDPKESENEALKFATFSSVVKRL